MNEAIEIIVSMIIIIVLIFGLGFCIGDIIANRIEADNLAKVLYKDTDKYLQHRHDNFYDLLKLVEIKEQECIKRK